MRHVCLDALASNTPKGQEAVRMREQADRLLVRYRRVSATITLCYAALCYVTLYFPVLRFPMLYTGISWLAAKHSSLVAFSAPSTSEFVWCKMCFTSIADDCIACVHCLEMLRIVLSVGLTHGSSVTP